MACPRCGRPLGPDGRCPEGHGAFLRGGAARAEVPGFRRFRFLVSVAESPRSPHACPECSRAMRAVTARLSGGGALDVEACAWCSGVWFDAGELDTARARGVLPPPGSPADILIEAVVYGVVEALTG